MKKFIISFLILFTSLLSAQVLQNEEPAELPPDDAEFLSDVITAQGIYIRSLGNFGKVWANATGGYVGYGIFFPNHNMLDFQVGYIKYKLSDDIENEVADFSVIPLLVGGRYFFIDDRFMPYISFMNGINIINQTVGFSVDEEENIHFEEITDNARIVRYAFQVGMGIMINIVGNLNVDLAVKYNAHFYQHEAMNTGFEYGIGIAWSMDD